MLISDNIFQMSTNNLHLVQLTIEVINVIIHLVWYISTDATDTWLNLIWLPKTTITNKGISIVLTRTTLQWHSPQCHYLRFVAVVNNSSQYENWPSLVAQKCRHWIFTLFGLIPSNVDYGKWQCNSSDRNETMKTVEQVKISNLWCDKLPMFWIW